MGFAYGETGTDSPSRGGPACLAADFGCRPKRAKVDWSAKGISRPKFIGVWRAGSRATVQRPGVATGLQLARIACFGLLHDLRQARSRSASHMDPLVANPGHHRAIVELFESIFDPDLAPDGRGRRASRIRRRLAGALDAVDDLDQDRILRRYLNLVQAMLRTNYYQRGSDGAPKGYISFKIDSGAVEDLPEPAPMFEIFVYTPRMEAIHLRGGKVARGGIRWSDRREDFRTEILGLMKAQ